MSYLMVSHGFQTLKITEIKVGKGGWGVSDITKCWGRSVSAS